MAEDVLEAVRALGGHDAWGVLAFESGQFYLDPGILVDRLFPTVIELLNDVMEQTPIPGLLSVDSNAPGNKPPPNLVQGSFDPFNPRFRASIRWQLGL